MFSVKRLYYAGPPAALVVAFTLFSALTAAGAHTQTVCQVPGDHATIQAAVDDVACETVNVGIGIYTETITISRTVTIQGRGASNSQVDGNASGSVFSIRGGAAVTLTGLTVINGSASAGGGIAVSAGWDEQTEVHVVRCKIAGNSATYYGGGVRLYGGMLGSAKVYLIDTTVEGNSATDGGGIYSNGDRFGDARLYVTNSTLRDNVGSDYGGGICNAGYSAISVTNSTISGNSASYGGGISNGGGGVTITYSTLSANSATENGGGIYNYWPAPNGYPYVGLTYFRASNSIVANSPLGGACFNDGDASIRSLGHNIDSDGTCGLAAADDLLGTDPLLGPLQDNGGPTLTHALLEGSPAIDSGDDTACPAADQRSVPRRQDGDGDGRAGCDIGAFELAGGFSMFLPLIEW